MNTDALLNVQRNFLSVLHKLIVPAVHGVFHGIYEKVTKVYDNDEDMHTHLQWAINCTSTWNARVVASVAAPYSRVARECVIVAKKLAKCNLMIQMQSGFAEARDPDTIDLKITFPELLHAIIVSTSRIVAQNVQCIMTPNPSQLSNLMHENGIVQDAVATVAKENMIESSDDLLKVQQLAKKLGEEYEKAKFRADEIEQKERDRQEEMKQEREMREQFRKDALERECALKEKMDAELSSVRQKLQLYIESDAKASVKVHEPEAQKPSLLGIKTSDEESEPVALPVAESDKPELALVPEQLILRTGDSVSDPPTIRRIVSVGDMVTMADAAPAEHVQALTSKETDRPIVTSTQASAADANRKEIYESECLAVVAEQASVVAGANGEVSLRDVSEGHSIVADEVVNEKAGASEAIIYTAMTERAILSPEHKLPQHPNSPRTHSKSDAINMKDMEDYVQKRISEAMTAQSVAARNNTDGDKVVMVPARDDSPRRHHYANYEESDYDISGL